MAYTKIIMYDSHSLRVLCLLAKITISDIFMIIFDLVRRARLKNSKRRSISDSSAMKSYGAVRSWDNTRFPENFHIICCRRPRMATRREQWGVAINLALKTRMRRKWWRARTAWISRCYLSLINSVDTFHEFWRKKNAWKTNGVGIKEVVSNRKEIFRRL